MLKKINIIIILFLLIIWVKGYSCNATEINSYKISKTVTPYESFESNKGGEIIIKIEDISLNSDSTYKYQLEYNNLKTQWYDISEVDVENKSLEFKLDNSKTDILSILKITDNAILTIQEINKNETVNNIIENLTLDVSLPLSKAFKVIHNVKNASGFHGIVRQYGINEIYFKYVLVENEEIIKKYLDYLNGYNNQESIYWGYYVDDLIDSINLQNEIPQDGWRLLPDDDCTDIQPTEKGLYFIWIKAPKTEENKELIGCVFSKRFSNIEVLKKQLSDVQEKNTELTAVVTYNPTTKTKGDVIATIKTNKEVNKVDGWELSEEGNLLTKSYSSNTTETVHLVDKQGKTKDVKIIIDNIITDEIENTQNNELKDNTITDGPLPNGGIKITVLIGIIIMCSIVLFLHKRYNKLKD